MKYRPKSLSIGNLFFSGACSFLLIGLFSCQLETKHEQQNGNSPQSLVDPKYSLTEDRAQFEKLRESIPERKKQINDEKALFADWTAGLRLSPNEVREKYDNLARKKRDLFNQDMSKAREDMSKSEKQKRDLFLQQLDNERVDFSKRKKDREERNDFYNHQDDKRRRFFAEERDKREEFESTMRDQRKSFEDYLKEKSLEFTSELKSYNESWILQNKNRNHD